MKRFAVAASLGVAICGGAAGCAAPTPQHEEAATMIVTSELDDVVEVDTTLVVPPEESDETDETALVGGRQFVARSHRVESYLIDGVLVRYDGLESFRWTFRGYFDLDDGYFYLFSEGIAEPGDFGCSENLIVGGGSYIRDTFDPGNEVDFRVGDYLADSAAIYDSDLLDFYTPTDAVAYYKNLGLLAPEPNAEGVRTLQLDIDQILALHERRRLPGTWNSPGRSAIEGFGTLETIEDGDGVLQQVSVTLVEVGNVRTLDDGTTQQPHQETNAVLTIAPLDPLAPRISPSTPRPQEGYCADLTADVPGEWDLAGVEDDDAWIAVDESGQITGAAACLSFEGTAELAYDRLADVNVNVRGIECPEGQPLARELIELLRSDPHVFIHEGNLILYEENGLYLTFEPR